MRQRVIAGNWKMNGSRSTIVALLESLKASVEPQSGVKWIVFPPFVYIEQVAQALENTPIAWGGQNLSDAAQGAYTGEVAGTMLRDVGCEFVLVGHSERRALYGEGDSVVAQKFVAALAAGLKPILCVGETLVEREQGLTYQVIERQLEAVIASGVSLKNAMIAYEPVWAIGTGKTASAKEAQDVHSRIRAQVAKRDEALAIKLPILYGGSVKANNAQGFFAMPDVDGVLVGGASLDAQEFLEIGRASVREP